MTGEDLAAQIASHRPGFSLPAALYHARAAYQLDLERIFRTEWLFACPVAELAAPGDHVTLQVGPDPIVVVRDGDTIRAFHNVCRHRGSKICLQARGHAARLTCPYHQWTYALSGELLHAATMGEGFDPAGYALAPVAVANVGGLVYVSLADDPPDLGRFAGTVEPFLAPHQLERTKVAHRSRIVEQANWKLVIENNRECYHCAANHPDLLASFLEVPLLGDEAGAARFEAIVGPARAQWDALGLPHLGVARDREFRCVRLPFDHGAVSMTRDGQQGCALLLGDLEDPDLGSVRLFRTPNNWHHVLADHSVHCRALPIGPGETELVTTWLVHEDAVEGLDYRADELSAVWLATNEEDRVLAENNQAGTLSSAYRPGPYGEKEALVRDFVDWYMAKISGPPALRMAAE